MSQTLAPSARRVQAALERLGLTLEVREFPAGTRTALDAAAAVGCDVAQIVKSLVFRAADTDGFVLVLASGANRVDEHKVGAALGEPIVRADPDFVRERTGFAIGGVPPVGHATEPITLIDEDLLVQPELWAAAGTPNAVFRLAPEDLERITGGRVVAIR